MLKPQAIVHGHYECRSLDETLPVFTDLLASEVVERKNGQAVVKHPNTDWLLIVHEGGPNAPDKPRLNHYGFRVAHHMEVKKAREYILANQAKYGLRSVSETDSIHYAFSFYLSEPGGNDLEIEYYNPKAADHGRHIATPPWKTLLTEELFPGRGYIPQALSHGTLECDDGDASRRFYQEVLGLDIVGGARISMYIARPPVPWYIVVIPMKKRTYLSPSNRFTLQVASPEEAEYARRAFLDSGKKLGITEVGELEERDRRVSFIFSDLDRNWWEVLA